MKTQVVIEESSKPVKLLWMLGQCMAWAGSLVLMSMVVIHYTYPYLTAAAALASWCMGMILLLLAKFLNFWDRGGI